MKIEDKRRGAKELTEYHLGDVIVTEVGDKKVIQMVSAHPKYGLVFGDDHYTGELDRYCMVNLETGLCECTGNSLKELFRNRHVHEDKLVKANVVIDRDDTNGK